MTTEPQGDRGKGRSLAARGNARQRRALRRWFARILSPVDYDALFRCGTTASVHVVVTIGSAS